MPRPPKKLYRVTLASSFTSDNIYGSFRGVLDFKEEVRHWRLVSNISSPICPFEQIDFASVDGIVGFFRESRWVDATLRAGVKAVNLSNSIADASIPRLGNDDEAIGALAGEHLLARGFVNFGFVGLTALWFSDRRLAGFERAVVQKAGRRCETITLRDQPNYDLEPIVSWLSKLPKPVGVMAVTDTLGRLVIEAAAQHGLRVPDDLAVIGVDNDRWFTHMTSVPMSSVEPDWRQIGYLAAQWLDRLMLGKTLVERSRWIAPVGVVTRASTDVVVSEDPVVANALRFIRDNCHRGIGVENILDHLRISRRQLELRLKRSIKQTPHAAICSAQVERAKSLLAYTDTSVSQIARACGLPQNHFYVIFKRLTGQTPGQYRRRTEAHRD